MKVLAPVTVTPAMLLSSNLPETEHPAWSSGTTYALAARVIYLNRVYESLQASNIARTPGAAASATWWLYVSPSNRWAMFDNVVDTASTAAGPIVVSVQPGVYCNALALVATVGDTARVRVLDGATTVYDETKLLDSTPLVDWDGYFFAADALVGDLLFTGLPRYLNGVFEVTVQGLSVSVGVLSIGTAHELGDAEHGATAGITDYSRKETDDFGATSLVQRSYARRSNQRLVVPISDIRRLQALLAGLRATPAVWVGADDTDTYSPLVVYGWFKDFRIDIAYPQYAYCTLEIEGLT